LVKRIIVCYKHDAPLELHKKTLIRILNLAPQYLKKNLRTLATQSLRPFKKTFANRKAISYLCTVLKIIESYHERRRDRPDETLATLYHKEGAKFYFTLIHSIKDR